MQIDKITDVVNIQKSLVKKAEYLKVHEGDLHVIATLKHILENEPLDDTVSQALSEFLGVWSNIDAAAASLIENVPPLSPDYGTMQERMLNATLIDFKNAWNDEK